MNRLLYGIGDTHGCSNALIRLMNKIEEDRAGELTTVVFLGDYTDRGPNSAGVIEHLLDLKLFPENGMEYIFLRGNHDQMLMDYQMNPNSEMSANWIYNGGGITLQSYLNSDFTLQEHIKQFFVHTQMSYRHGDFYFVHAGCNPNKGLDEQTEIDYLWNRGWNNYKGTFPDNVFVIHGHTPEEKPWIRPNMIGIDTGCCFQTKYPEFKLGLTAVRLNSRTDYKFLHANEYPPILKA